MTAVRLTGKEIKCGDLVIEYDYRGELICINFIKAIDEDGDFIATVIWFDEDFGLREQLHFGLDDNLLDTQTETYKIQRPKNA